MYVCHLMHACELAKSFRTTTWLKAVHCCFRSPTLRRYSALSTTAHSALLRSCKPRVKSTLKESTSASAGGGNSIDGTSAVGWAKKISRYKHVLKFCVM